MLALCAVHAEQKTQRYKDGVLENVIRFAMVRGRTADGRMNWRSILVPKPRVGGPVCSCGSTSHSGRCRHRQIAEHHDDRGVRKDWKRSRAHQCRAIVKTPRNFS